MKCISLAIFKESRGQAPQPLYSIVVRKQTKKQNLGDLVTMPHAKR